jgi:hypothetical protein
MGICTVDYVLREGLRREQMEVVLKIEQTTFSPKKGLPKQMPVTREHHS